MINFIKEIETKIKDLEIDKVKQTELINLLSNVLFEYNTLEEEKKKLESTIRAKEDTNSTLRVKYNMLESMLRGILDY